MIDLEERAEIHRWHGSEGLGMTMIARRLEVAEATEAAALSSAEEFAALGGAGTVSSSGRRPPKSVMNGLESSRLPRPARGGIIAPNGQD
jgi:hypothetical protein